jgi:hypothetical protein
MNIRVVILYLAEFLHDQTGVRVLQLYKAVDLICIWLAFIILLHICANSSAHGRRLSASIFCPYLAADPFALHFYHPYDRASLVAWLLAIWCARARRFWEFSAVAIVAVLIKFDAIVLPGLYFWAMRHIRLGVSIYFSLLPSP